MHLLFQLFSAATWSTLISCLLFLIAMLWGKQHLLMTESHKWLEALFRDLFSLASPALHLILPICCFTALTSVLKPPNFTCKIWNSKSARSDTWTTCFLEAWVQEVVFQGYKRELLFLPPSHSLISNLPASPSIRSFPVGLLDEGIIAEAERL